jgi:hypothetical protein
MLQNIKTPLGEFEGAERRNVIGQLAEEGATVAGRDHMLMAVRAGEKHYWG